MKFLNYTLKYFAILAFILPVNSFAQCGTPISNTNSFTTFSGERILGQTFTAECSSDLSSITVRSNSVLTTIPNVTLKIWDYRGLLLGWEEIYTQSGIVLNGLNTNTEILISGSADIDDGHTYAFTLEHASINLELRGELAGNYLEGRSILDNFVSTDLLSLNDLYFEIEATSLLPVEFASFDNVIKNNFVYLEWSTKSEKDNLGFEIQKSNNGSDWSSLAFQEGARNSNDLQFYEFVDRQPIPGKNYYRLKQIDLDGTFEYSTINVADLAYIEEAKIYPNPAVDRISIYIPELYQRRAVRVFNIHGKQVFETEKLEDFNLELDISDLSDGIYTVKSDKIFLGRFIKKRR